MRNELAGVRDHSHTQLFQEVSCEGKQGNGGELKEGIREVLFLIGVRGEKYG